MNPPLEVLPALTGVSPELARRRLRTLVGRTPGTLLVHEIYRSLQGESTHAGLPCTFVRLTACHLRCNYCDTRHAFYEGAEMDVAEVARQALATGDALVEVTGGEPLLQPEVLPLLARLADAGRTVLLETSGSIDIRPVDPRVVVILDVKPPGSGEVAANLASNLDALKPGDEVKYVVSHRDDFDWTVAHVRDNGLVGRAHLLIGAVFGRVAPTDLAAWVLESGLPLRLQVQLHKQLWAPDARGV